jgi:hypothetical protein
MIKNTKNTLLPLAVILCSLLCNTSYAIHAIVTNPHHGGHVDPYRGHHYHDDDHYNRGWVSPNIIIEAPYSRFYAPICQRVTVCNRFHDCWIEERCN